MGENSEETDVVFDDGVTLHDEYDSQELKEVPLLAPNHDKGNTANLLDIEFGLTDEVVEAKKSKAKKKKSTGTRLGRKEEKEWASALHKFHVDKVIKHIKSLHQEMQGKAWGEIALKCVPDEIRNMVTHEESKSKLKTETTKSKKKLRSKSFSPSSDHKKFKNLNEDEKKTHNFNLPSNVDDTKIRKYPIRNRKLRDATTAGNESHTVKTESQDCFSVADDDDELKPEVNFDSKPVTLSKIKKFYTWFIRNFLVVYENCSSNAIYDEFNPTLFKNFPVNVSLMLSVEIFVMMANCLGFCARSVWVLDKLVVPNRFLEKHFCPTAESILSFDHKENYNYPVKFLSHWDAENKSIKKPSYFQVCETAEIKDESDNSELVFARGVDKDEPFCWVEIWNSDRWLTLDIARCIFDIPGAMLGKKPKDSLAGIVLAINPWGYLTQVMAKYSKPYSMGVLRVADVNWLDSKLKEYNSSIQLADKNSINENSYFIKYDQDFTQDVAVNEPFPTVLEVYKKHPFYCIERFVGRLRVLRPNSKPVHTLKNGELVYKRSDISKIHTSERWVEHGYQVIANETPKVYLRKMSLSNVGLSEEESEKVGYYGDWQVEAYDPGEIVNGIIPKNKFGNVYHFSDGSLPRGASKLPNNPRIRHVCKRLGFDCAQAMVGFKMLGGWFTPDLDGWIVASENKDAILEELNREEIKRDNEKRQKRIEQIWANWINIFYSLLVKKILEITKQDDIKCQPSHLHTHSFPEELIKKKGNLAIMQCPCGFKQTLEKL